MRFIPIQWGVSHYRATGLLNADHLIGINNMNLRVFLGYVFKILGWRFTNDIATFLTVVHHAANQTTIRMCDDLVSDNDCDGCPRLEYLIK